MYLHRLGASGNGNNMSFLLSGIPSIMSTRGVRPVGKGQLISKCPFGIIVWTKIPTKLFLDFCPEFFL